MSYCSDCFNGCGDKLTTDQCVRYTGEDNEVLGISNGDNLLTVENALVQYLVSVISGEGIILDIEVSGYLEDTETITALDLFKALIQAACDLQEQIGAINVTLATLNANYDVGCLEDVESTSDTHDVLQAVITKLCELDVSLTALAIDVSTNYVKLADLNTLIQEYLDSIEITDKAYTKMVPYVAQEYYGATSNYPETGDSFDVNGVGSGYWENVYLCNGYNGLTPDKRGRVAVGAIIGMAGGALDPEVDPGVDPIFNPNYSLNDTEGNNSITLTTDEIPEHIHSITDVTHTHFSVKTGDFAGAAITSSTPIAEKDSAGSGDEEYELSGGTDPADIGLTSEAYTGLTATDVNTTAQDAHDNKQPVIAAYYIMFIPV